MAKAIWRGTISFGLVTIPVELFPAISREELAFHLLDGRDMSPIHNKRVNESTGEEVPWESVVKGTQLDDGRWVTLTDDELKSANVRATRTIDILGAVCVEDIAVAMYETPYYLAPEAQGAKAYALLRESLRRAGRIAVGRIVMAITALLFAGSRCSAAETAAAKGPLVLENAFCRLEVDAVHGTLVRLVDKEGVTYADAAILEFAHRTRRFGR